MKIYEIEQVSRRSEKQFCKSGKHVSLGYSIINITNRKKR